MLFTTVFLYYSAQIDSLSVKREQTLLEGIIRLLYSTTTPFSMSFAYVVTKNHREDYW